MPQVISKLTLIPDVNAPSPTDGQALLWDAASGKWIPGTAGVTDHGALTGLDDDDHTQYAKLAGDTFTGAVLIPGGSVGAPALAFATSTGTGMYYQPSHKLGFATLGTSRLLLNPSVAAVQVPSGTNLFINGGELTIAEDTATNVPLTVKGAASQSANLQEWQDSAGGIQLAIGPTGQLKTNQASANTNTPSGATAYQLPIYNTAGTLLGYVPIYGSAW